MKTRIQFLEAVGACLLLVGLTGCADDSGYQLSGNVTFNGQPVPAGKIYLTPDSSKGNDGPTGYADIVDGYFDTSGEGGKPVAGGPMIVGIEGFDPDAVVEATAGDTSGEKTVQILFPYYETTKDIPQEDATIDFEVPAAAANRKDRAEGRP